MIILVVLKKIYKKQYDNIRSVINYSILIIISIIFIIADAADIGDGIGASIALGILLIFNVLLNLGGWIYTEYKDYEIDKKV